MTSELIGLFVVFVGLATMLANIAIWAPRKAWVRGCAVAGVALFIPVVYASLGELLSRPKPIDLEWRHRDVSEATVVSAIMREGSAIYLWLQLPETEEPRAYALPWDQSLAKQLHEAQQQAEANGNGLRVRLPLESSLDEREPVFYAPPQPPLPPTQVPGQGPL
jgi:hypothetical protein